MTPQERQERREKHRPHGRTMPHPHEAKRSDGTIDPEAVKAALPEVIAAFESGEYILKDMNEGQITNNTVHQIERSLGVTCQPGDEFFIVIRKRT